MVKKNPLYLGLTCKKFRAIVADTDRYYERLSICPDKDERYNDIAGGMEDEIGIAASSITNATIDHWMDKCMVMKKRKRYDDGIRRGFYKKGKCSYYGPVDKKGKPIKR